MFTTLQKYNHQIGLTQKTRISILIRKEKYDRYVDSWLQQSKIYWISAH